MYKQTKNLVQSGSLNILKTYIFVAYGGSYNPSFEFVRIEPLFVFSFVKKSLPAGTLVGSARGISPNGNLGWSKGGPAMES